MTNNGLEDKLKSASFWIKLGAINHLITIAVIISALFASVLSPDEDAFKNVLSIYAFTILTPQIALEVILVLALFLITNKLSDLTKDLTAFCLFIATAFLITGFVFWHS